MTKYDVLVFVSRGSDGRAMISVPSLKRYARREGGSWSFGAFDMEVLKEFRIATEAADLLKQAKEVLGLE